MENNETLYIIYGNKFTAGVIVDGWGRVKECAPILRKFIKGKGMGELIKIARRKNWQILKILNKEDNIK